MSQSPIHSLTHAWIITIFVSLLSSASAKPASSSEPNRQSRTSALHGTTLAAKNAKTKSVSESCADAAAVLSTDPENKAALATINRWLTSARSGDRLDAAVAVQKAGPQAKRMTAALIRSLQDESASVRGEAATALGTIGPAARSALPALRQTAQAEHPGEQGAGCCMVRRDNWIHSAANEAIKKISASTK